MTAGALPSRGRVASGLLAGLAVLLSACPGHNEATPYRREFLAFGTTVAIEIRDTDATRAGHAADDVERFFHSVDRDWYAYGDGELARVNAGLLRGDAVELSPTLAPLVARSIDFSRLSGGLFDPAIADLVRLWRFDHAESVTAAPGPPPPQAIEALRARRGTFADLRLNGRRLSSARPVALDLGGIAKGTALARARQLLRANGIANALVDVGGSSLLALGRHGGRQGDRPWRVGIQNPRGRGTLGDLELEPGESVSTSGDYERFFASNGRRYAHVLDPRTGYPTTAVAGVTVIATDPELADAASTALMVGGPREFDRLRNAFHLRAALLITSTGELVMSPAMRQRLLLKGTLPFSSSL